MATDKDYLAYAQDQLSTFNPKISAKKMFGDYCIYYDGMPLFLICDNAVFIKELEVLKEEGMAEGHPYEGSKLFFIVDIDDRGNLEEIVRKAIPFLELPKKKRKSQKK